MAWYFLGYFSGISDGYPYPFYPEVTPQGFREFLQSYVTASDSVSTNANFLLATDPGYSHT